MLAGKVYAKFHLDVGLGDAVVGEPERLVGDDLLDFAGIGPAVALAVPKAQQFAETVHADTFPWTGRVNTRTKDLVDLVLLIQRGSLTPDDLRASLAATFATRNTHPLPPAHPPPPDGWAVDFPGLAVETGLSVTDHLSAYAVLAAYWTTHPRPTRSARPPPPPARSGWWRPTG